MKRTLHGLVYASALAALGCAGKLDADYYAGYQGGDYDNYQAGEPAVVKVKEAGAAGAAWRDAGGAWRDAAAERVDWDAGEAAQAGNASPAQAGGASLQPPAAGSAGAAGSAAAATCDFRGLLQRKCSNPSCHGSPALSSGLDLTSPGLAMRVSGRQAGGGCSDKLLIDSAAPARSALYLRVSSTACGAQMPLGGSLTTDEQACVLSWIDAL